MSSVRKLVNQAKKGDGEAFITLIRQYETVLYRMASRILKNEEDIADAIQEAVLTAYEKIHSLKKPAYFNTWICKILLNKCYAILKDTPDTTALYEGIPVHSEGNTLRSMELEEALNSLREPYKEALTLYYIVGLNIREISEFLEEPEGTIKSRLSRAKKKIRKTYYPYEGEIVCEK